MKRYFTLLFLFTVLGSYAQMDLLDSMMKTEKPKREYVSYTFKSTRILTGHSIEMVKKNAIDFRVSHRFGDLEVTSLAPAKFGRYTDAHNAAAFLGKNLWI